MNNSLEYHTLQKLVSLMRGRSINRYQYNVGACIIDKKGQILSFGTNSYSKTHPIMVKNPYYKEEQIFVHAEVQAIMNCKNPNPYMMIVCRLDRSETIRIAKPCIGCYSLIKKSKLKKVYFTNMEGELSLLNTNIPIDEYYGGV